MLILRSIGILTGALLIASTTGCASCATFFAGYIIRGVFLDSEGIPISDAQIMIMFEREGSQIEATYDIAGRTEEDGTLFGDIQTAFASGCGLTETPENIKAPPIPDLARITVVTENTAVEITVAIQVTAIQSEIATVLVELGTIQLP